MPHIHTESGQHDHTVSAYIVRLDFDAPRIMLHLHKKLGIYLQFGGHIELNETPWQAIKHELLEESGYEIAQLNVLQPKNRLKSLSNNILHPIPLSYSTHDISGIASDAHFHTDISFVFTTTQAPKNPIGNNESQDIILLSNREVSKFDKTYPYIKETTDFIFKEVLLNWEQVDPLTFKDY